MDQVHRGRNLSLSRRQQCACLIQEIASRLQTTQVVINASIYYMHHIYEVFSPETIKPIMVSLASLYIACKTEDFSRKLSLLIKAAYDTLGKPMPQETSDTFKRIVQNVHALEAAILMIIGFHTLEVKQPHVILINAIRANNFPKEISHTSYYICTNMLHLTTLVLRHSAEAIAASCLYIAAKWNSTDIKSSSGVDWFNVFSPNLTLEEIKQISDEFTLAFQACDRKIREQLQNSLRVSLLLFIAILQARKLIREESIPRAVIHDKRVGSFDPQRQTGVKIDPSKTSRLTDKRIYPEPPGPTGAPSVPHIPFTTQHTHHHPRVINPGAGGHPYHNQAYNQQASQAQQNFNVNRSQANLPVQPAHYASSRAGAPAEQPDIKRQRLDRNFLHIYPDPQCNRPREDSRVPRFLPTNNRSNIGKPNGHPSTFNLGRATASKNDLHEFF
ncbi:unnamed protein product [Protopolystoma xenopodis]|uniref:Cyclin-like domain-containing protein n=1 Tax=Protopolystoma xenopodis TaxID=117903 RepID=A0A448XB41_9PLAT|nr:unnamed protein product [Protopolystoma xenopodis]